uniref:Uncharacterized protein n=2 Tax=Lotharella globosa TaxID=91324 RepID=A0A7S4DLY3_9EUKA
MREYDEEKGPLPSPPRSGFSKNLEVPQGASGVVNRLRRIPSLQHFLGHSKRKFQNHPAPRPEDLKKVASASDIGPPQPWKSPETSGDSISTTAATRGSSSQSRASSVASSRRGSQRRAAEPMLSRATSDQSTKMSEMSKRLTRSDASFSRNLSDALQNKPAQMKGGSSGRSGVGAIWRRNVRGGKQQDMEDESQRFRIHNEWDLRWNRGARYPAAIASIRCRPCSPSAGMAHFCVASPSTPCIISTYPRCHENGAHGKCPLFASVHVCCGFMNPPPGYNCKHLLPPSDASSRKSRVSSTKPFKKELAKTRTCQDQERLDMLQFSGTVHKGIATHTSAQHRSALQDEISIQTNDKDRDTAFNQRTWDTYYSPSRVCVQQPRIDQSNSLLIRFNVITDCINSRKP